MVDVSGVFEAGDPVQLVSGDGTVVARGLVNYSSAELPRMLGRSTHELADELGAEYERSIVHVNDLVVLQTAAAS